MSPASAPSSSFFFLSGSTTSSRTVSLSIVKGHHDSWSLDEKTVWYGIVGFDIHLTHHRPFQRWPPKPIARLVQKLLSPTNHLARTSKSKHNYTQVTTQNTLYSSSSNYWKVIITYAKLNLMKLKLGSGCLLCHTASTRIGTILLYLPKNTDKQAEIYNQM